MASSARVKLRPTTSSHDFSPQRKQTNSGATWTWVKSSATGCRHRTIPLSKMSHRKGELEEPWGRIHGLLPSGSAHFVIHHRIPPEGAHICYELPEAPCRIGCDGCSIGEKEARGPATIIYGLWLTNSCWLPNAPCRLGGASPNLALSERLNLGYTYTTPSLADL